MRLMISCLLGLLVACVYKEAEDTAAEQEVVEEVEDSAAEGEEETEGEESEEEESEDEMQK